MDWVGFKDSGLYVKILKLILGPEGLLKAGLYRLVDEEDIDDTRDGIILCCRYNHLILLRKLLSTIVISNIDLFKLCCQHGCDLMIFDELTSNITEQSILHDGILLCCQYNHPTLLRKLCVKLKGHDWRFILKLNSVLIDNQYVEILKILIEKKLLDNLYIDPILTTVVYKNNLKVVEYLLTQVNTCWIDKVFTDTILSCSLECFKLLYAACSAYHSYLYRAAYNGRADIVRFLLQINGVHVIESTIRDVIHNSIELGHLDVADVIIDRYPNTHVYPMSILHTLSKGNFKIARKLNRNVYWGCFRSELINCSPAIVAGMVAIGVSLFRKK